MKLVCTTSVYPFDYDPFAALRGLKSFGYDAADIALDYYTSCAANGMARDDWEEPIKRLRALSDELGIPYTHAHSPFDVRALDHPTQGPILRRSIRAAAMLGARMMVVHPAWKRADGTIIESPDEFLSVNTAYNRRLLDDAEAAGVILLSENLLWGASIDPVNVAALAAETASPYFGWCWDTGHSHLNGVKPERLLQTVTPPLSLHIQDNNRRGDEHLIPGDGSICWPTVFTVLKQIGYKGEFVLEAHHQSVEAPNEKVRADILTKLEGTARNLMGLYF